MIALRKMFVGAGIVVLAAVAAIAPATGVQAATTPTQDMQFSADGDHWSDSYIGALFGGVMLVPGGSSERAFYLRNTAPEPATMRVTLFDVATTDTALADAMSVMASTPDQPGTPIAVSSARPCVTLTEGQTLESGDSIRVDTFAMLADLTGTAGQARNVSFKIAVTLASIDSAAPPPNSCPGYQTSATVVGVPAARGTVAIPVYHLGASGWTAPANSPASMPPVVRQLLANTERLYQENVVALWLGMAVLGALILLFMRRRRSDDELADNSQSPNTRQNGTGR